MRHNKEDIEEPIKKSPLLIIGLFLLLALLLATGILLVKWYVDNQEMGIPQASLDRVIVSGVAVLILILILSTVLFNVLRNHSNRSSRRKPVATGASTHRRTATHKQPVRRAGTTRRTTTKRTTNH